MPMGQPYNGQPANGQPDAQAIRGVNDTKFILMERSECCRRDNISSLEQADNDGLTPVCVASQNGHLDSLRFLAEHKASLEQADNYGWTPVYVASKEGNLDCLRFLAEHKASLHGAGYQ